MSSSSLRIIVTGLVAQVPMGGMTWHYLQYLLGLRRLGHDVYYVEDTGMWPYNPRAGGTSTDCGFNVGYLAGVMGDFGLADRWAYCYSAEDRWFGLPDQRRMEVIESADLLINVSGSLDRPRDYRQVPRLAFVDTDPIFTQIRIARAQGNHQHRVNVHDVHFSFGERLAGAGPATGHHWRPTRQPIMLSEWHPETPRRELFTTVMNWTKRRQPRVFQGQTYGEKDLELSRFLELPAGLAPGTLEIALNAGRDQQAPRDLRAAKGWRVVDPELVCPDYDSYHRYIEASKAEWSVAKHGYVVGQAGWFSDRSACYLAAGRPVVLQDTGFSAVLPTGRGIVPFTTVEEALAAIQEVEADYGRHARAARAIAEAHFDSDLVLSRLLEEAFSSDSTPREELVDDRAS